MFHLRRALIVALLSVPFMPPAWADGVVTASVTMAPEAALRSGDPIEFWVTVNDTALTDVAAIVLLREKESKTGIAPGGMVLCEGTVRCSPTQLMLSPNKTHHLTLWGASEVGVFEGSLTLTSAQKQLVAATVATKLYLSSNVHKAWGVAVIGLSVLAAWFGTVFLRNLQARRQLLLPVTFLRDALHGLSMDVAQMGTPAEDTLAQIRRTEAAVATRELERRGLPSCVPWTSNLDGFNEHMQRQTRWTQALKLAVRDGLQVIDAASDTATARSAAARELENALRDGRDEAPADADLRQAIAVALSGLTVTRALAPARDEVERLRLQINVVNAASWAWMLVLTTILGAFILVVSGPEAPGFGTWSSYFKCLLWGFGLPAGSQLFTLTTSSVTTLFAVPKP